MAWRDKVAAAKLSDTGEARRNKEAGSVSRDLALELFEEDGTDRARADEPHFSTNNVQQLRQFVQFRSSEKPADFAAIEITVFFA